MLPLLQQTQERFLRQLGEIMEILLSLLLHRVTLDYRAPKRGEKWNRTTRIVKGTIWILEENDMDIIVGREGRIIVLRMKRKIRAR